MHPMIKKNQSILTVGGNEVSAIAKLHAHRKDWTDRSYDRGTSVYFAKVRNFI